MFFREGESRNKKSNSIISANFVENIGCGKNKRNSDRQGMMMMSSSSPARSNSSNSNSIPSHELVGVAAAAAASSVLNNYL
jgi:hypothetical protein